MSVLSMRTDTCQGLALGSISDAIDARFSLQFISVSAGIVDRIRTLGVGAVTPGSDC